MWDERERKLRKMVPGWLCRASRVTVQLRVKEIMSQARALESILGVMIIPRSKKGLSRKC